MSDGICTAFTKVGYRCPHRARPGVDHCGRHLTDDERPLAGPPLYETERALGIERDRYEPSRVRPGYRTGAIGFADCRTSYPQVIVQGAEAALAADDGHCGACDQPIHYGDVMRRVVFYGDPYGDQLGRWWIHEHCVVIVTDRQALDTFETFTIHIDTETGADQT